MNNNFSGGTHSHYYNPPQQQDLNLQKKSEIIPIRFYPKEAEQLKKIAENRNRKASEFLRLIILKYLKSEKKINELSQILDEIII